MHYSSMMNLSHLTDPLQTLHTVRSTPDWINGYENISRWRKWRWVITLSQKFSFNYIFTGSGFHQFIFRIKFYSSEPSINLQEEITRYQFVLQLKKDILKGVLPVPYDTMIELSAQALQGRYLHFSILDNWCNRGCDMNPNMTTLFSHYSWNGWLSRREYWARRGFRISILSQSGWIHGVRHFWTL